MFLIYIRSLNDLIYLVTTMHYLLQRFVLYKGFLIITFELELYLKDNPSMKRIFLRIEYLFYRRSLGFIILKYVCILGKAYTKYINSKQPNSSLLYLLRAQGIHQVYKFKATKQFFLISPQSSKHTPSI